MVNENCQLPVVERFLYRLFWKCFFILAILIFAVLPFQFLIVSYGALQGFIGTVLCTALLFAGMIGLGCIQKRWHSARATWVILPILLFAFALAVRLTAVFLIGQGTTQVSDFMLAYETAQRPIPVQEMYYAIFSNWGMYSCYLKILFHLFGTAEFVAIAGNAFLEAGSTALIYYIVSLACHSRGNSNSSPAIIAALLYVLWPTQITYMVLCTPEFVNIFLLLLSVLCVLLAVHSYEQEKVGGGYHGFCLAIAAGGILSLSGFFKSVDKIMLIAIVIVAVLFCDKKAILGVLTRKDDSSFTHTKHFLSAGAFVVAYFVATAIGFSFLDFYIGRPVNRNPAIHYLNIGLSSESGGEWNATVASEYGTAVINNEYDYEKANQIIKDALLQDIKENKHLTPQFFYNKLTRAMQGQDYQEFAQATMSPEAQAYFHPNFSIFAQSYYWFVGLLVTIGSWGLLKEKPNKLLFCSALFVVGFLQLMFLSENQPRYKVVIYPYLCMLAGTGGSWLFDLFHKKAHSKMPEERNNVFSNSKGIFYAPKL